MADSVTLDRPLTGHAGAVAVPRPAGAAIVVLFGGTLFASSALLFLLEPMFAKMALPLLGGSPQVWNTCVVFFQALLLAGYAYAHAVSMRLGVRRQALLHGALVVAALLALPIRIAAGWAPPATGTPIPWLLALLAASVGVPFFVLSSTAPLLQKWFSRTGHGSASDPYFLYVASNAGSVTGLLAYPFLLEPLLRLGPQSAAWSAGYGVFAVLTVACGALFWHRCSGETTARPVVAPALARAEDAVSWSRRLTWLTLALVPSSLMLGVTTYLSTDIAPVPLLWILPLSLYLATFMLAFASRSLPRSIERLLPAAVLPLMLAMVVQATSPLWFLVTLHLLVFFLASFACHRRLAADRPGTSHLTEFYLWVAAGGALGGIFNTLIAPQIFNSVIEYPLAIVVACAIGLSAPQRRWSRSDVVVPIGVGLAVYLLLVATRLGTAPVPIAFAGLALPALLTFPVWTRPRSFAAALALILLAGQAWHGDQDHRLLVARRTFFGIHRVYEEAAAGQHTLFHGTTLHGRQNVRSADRDEPLTYFSRTGPIGQVFGSLPQLQRPARVAVIGLGSGTLATYARAGQEWTFYEIDPAVEAIARDPRLFTFLADSAARPSVVLGDARLSLARAVGARYDLIVLDAFSSDAIPVHLITKEAVQLYLARLADGGAVAFHISNRHLALRPVVARLASELGIVALAQRDPVSPAETRWGKQASEWVIVARERQALEPLTHDPRWVAAGARGPLWTDDFSNILSVLRTY